MLDVARKVLGVLLLAGCSIDVAGALEPQRSTEQSLSARNDELSLSLTVREVRAEGLVLEGRVNTELDGARAFVPDDEIGVTTLSTRGFTTVLPLAEVAARLSGSPLLIGVHTRAGAQHFARVSLALTLPSSCKVPGVSFDRPFSSVLLDGVPMVRLRGHATTPGLRSHAWLGGSEEAPRWKGRRAGQLFWLDLPLDMMTSALLPPAQLHVSFDTGDRERAKTCTPSVTVRALELTEDDPYDVWPAPSCSGALAQCLARDVHTHDTSACGEPYVVQACGPRPLPAACGIKQAKKLAHTMEGTLWMSETDAPFEPVSFAAQAEESATNGVSLERVARSYAGLGDIQTALDLAKKIQNEFDRAYAYQTIADIQAQSGEAKDVAAWAAELRSPYLKSSALLGIAYGILQRHGIDVRKSVL